MAADTPERDKVWQWARQNWIGDAYRFAVMYEADHDDRDRLICMARIWQGRRYEDRRNDLVRQVEELNRQIRVLDDWLGDLETRDFW